MHSSVIPRPASLRLDVESEAFSVGAGLSIQLGIEAGAETLFAARQLQAAVEDATGLVLALRKTTDPEGGAHRVALLLAGRDPGAADSNRLQEGSAEGYLLQVELRGITLSAKTEAGLFYGVQTLRQLLRTYGGRMPALTIHDWPVLAHRGVMLDVSRGKVPTLATLTALVDGLAAFKYNQFQLYVEHTFHFPGHPDIGAGTDPLTAEDILRLDEFCRARHVELVPNLQSFGHQRHLLSLPRYQHLDEVGWRWSLTPAREETYTLLDELYGDLLPAFSSRWLNVDCDETWDLGTGQSKSLAEELGKGRLYLQHILRLRDLAARYGRRIMLWADVLHHYPELVPDLPEDVLLLDWSYEAAESYPTTVPLGSSGRPFWVCPGTSSWNTLFPRIDNALQNIHRFVRDGLAAGATGMLLTDWGDYGHYLPLSLSWYAYVFGAATAWTGAQTPPETFDAVFAAQFLGQAGADRTVAAMRRLGAAATAPTLGVPNRSNIALALFEDPLAGRFQASADPRALAEVNAAAHEAIAAFAALPDRALRHDYGFSARLIAFAAARVILAQRVRETLVSLAQPGTAARRGEGLARLDQHIDALEAAQASVPALRAEFEARWLGHARRSEIGLTLEHFETLAQGYADALAWLDEQRSRYASGQSVDGDLAGYAPRAQVLLWEKGLAELRRLAALAGIDALPEDIRSWLERSQSS